MNLDKLRKHKDEANRQMAKGRVKEALDELLQVQKLDPHDLANRQKVGDLHRKLNNTPEAIKAYQAVSGAYAADGLLLKAIAVCKIILQIDPNHTETQRALADLYGKKRGDAASVELPSSMSAALGKPAPGQKLSASMIRGVPATQLPTNQQQGERVATGLPPPMPPQAMAPTPTDDVSLEIEVEAVEEVSAELDIVEASPVVGQPLPPPMPPRVAPHAVDIPERVITGVPVPPPVPGPAASWSAPPRPAPMPIDIPVVTAAGPADLEEMEMPGADPVVATPKGEVAGADEFADFLADEGAAPHKVDLDKLPPIPLFSDLSKNAFIDLMERMDIRSMSEGDVVIREGEKGDSFFIIASGQVRVEKTVADGTVVHLATLTDGTFFGEIALLSDAPRTASVVAATDGELFEISRSTLDAVVKDFPSVAAVLQKFYKQRLLSNLLNTSPIFSQFDKNQRKSLIEMFRSREVAPGEAILTEGQKGDGLYVMLSGRATVSKGDKQLATLKEGDLFGEMSLLTRDPVSATITATGRTLVLRLPRKQFNEVIMTHPLVLEMVSELSARRQRSNV